MKKTAVQGHARAISYACLVFAGTQVLLAVRMKTGTSQNNWLLKQTDPMKIRQRYYDGNLNNRHGEGTLQSEL